MQFRDTVRVPHSSALFPATYAPSEKRSTAISGPALRRFGTFGLAEFFMRLHAAPNAGPERPVSLSVKPCLEEVSIHTNPCARKALTMEDDSDLSVVLQAARHVDRHTS